MLRKNVVSQLRAVGDAARDINALSFEYPDTGELIELDAKLAKHLICMSLAYAVVLIDGRLKVQDPKDAVTSIISAVGYAYVESE
jgi:hypothetical protein